MNSYTAKVLIAALCTPTAALAAPPTVQERCAEAHARQQAQRAQEREAREERDRAREAKREADQQGITGHDRRRYVELHRR